MPSGARVGAAAPPWSSGPRKLLAAEPWLETMALAVGEKLGTCDYRFPANDDAAEIAVPVDPALLVRQKGTLNKKAFDYPEEARKIGGCGAEHRPTEPSLGLAQAERELAARLCGGGRGVVPQGSARDLQAVARNLVTRFYARDASMEESSRLAREMEECLAVKKTGCATPDAAARWLCVRLATSAEFGTY
jgi:hypothetical protein